MGRKNRKRNRKNSPQKLEPEEAPTELQPPSISEMQETKEKFAENLKSSFKTALSLCKTFQAQAGGGPGPETPLDEFIAVHRLQEVFWFDPSNEISQIFNAQLSQFLQELVGFMASAAGGPLESFISVLGSCVKSLDYLIASLKGQTLCIFQEFTHKNDLDSYCRSLFCDLLMEDPCTSAQIAPEENLALFRDLLGLSKRRKHKKKRKTPEDSALDREIEEFQQKLDLHHYAGHRLKPKVSTEWITSLGLAP